MRSYRAAPGARPYYLCPALTSDLLSPARALLCVSTWPLEQRIIGPLSPRVDFLTAAIRTAEAARALSGAGAANLAAERLLRRFAMNIPGAGPAHPGGSVTAEAIAAAAQRRAGRSTPPGTRTTGRRPRAAHGSSMTRSSCSEPG